MGKIENCLIKAGFKNIDGYPEYKGSYSTMENVRCGWDKKGVKTMFITGLNFHPNPPTLVEPIPKECDEFLSNKLAETKDYSLIAKIDLIVNDWIQKTPEEDIINWINSFE